MASSIEYCCRQPAFVTTVTMPLKGVTEKKEAFTILDCHTVTCFNVDTYMANVAVQAHALHVTLMWQTCTRATSEPHITLVALLCCQALQILLCCLAALALQS